MAASPAGRERQPRVIPLASRMVSAAGSLFTVHAYARTRKTFLRWLRLEGYAEKPKTMYVRIPLR